MRAPTSKKGETWIPWPDGGEWSTTTARWLRSKTSSWHCKGCWLARRPDIAWRLMCHSSFTSSTQRSGHPSKSTMDRESPYAPILAPRCARARSKHLGVPDEVPKGTGCHTHAGRGWTNEFAANNIDASRLLPLTGDVLTPAVLGRTTLSADAYRYVVERNKLYVDLKLFPPA